jgi:hypothetical protein
MVESDKSASYAAAPSGNPPRPADVVAAILRNSQRGFTFSRRRSSCMVNRAFVCTCVIYVIVANNSRSYTSTTLVLSRAFFLTRHCGWLSLTKFCHSPRVSFASCLETILTGRFVGLSREFLAKVRDARNYVDSDLDVECASIAYKHIPFFPQRHRNAGIVAAIHPGYITPDGSEL